VDIRGQLPQGAPKGPVITEVAQQGPAAASGLQQGDIILKLGNSPIVSANQLTALLKSSDLKSGVRLFVWRGGETLYTILQSGDE
jgi:S1-C subfamily serine protease